ncbi:glycosyl transferase, partial [Candidatus Roizmanbacteria bacterium CG22_combo_CG10-13_8_21_14_all_35_9]
MFKKKKIAIVYDWIDKWGGVERVLLTLHEMFPEATFYTSYFDSEKASWARDLRIETSFIQRLPKIIRGRRIVSLPLYPYAFESFNFNKFDLVISVTSSFAKSIITQPRTKHICYLLTPTRYLWSHQKDYFKKNIVNSYYLEKLKDWDFITAQRPDKIISISETVKNRCNKYYHRKSEVIYPPFDIEYWKKISNLKSQMSNLNLKSKNYFLIVSRLEPYKKIDLAVKVFNRLKDNLIIVGEGSEENNLRRISGKNIIFLSKLTDQDLALLYSNAEALIMPQEEDFGLVSLEAQFFGCPMISYKKGGALETVTEGKTGIFFKEQSEISLGRAVEKFNRIKYNLKISTVKFGLKNLERFDRVFFEKKFISSIENVKSQMTNNKS